MAARPSSPAESIAAPFVSLTREVCHGGRNLSNQSAVATTPLGEKVRPGTYEGGHARYRRIHKSAVPSTMALPWPAGCTHRRKGWPLGQPVSSVRMCAWELDVGRGGSHASPRFGGVKSSREAWRHRGALPLRAMSVSGCFVLKNRLSYAMAPNSSRYSFSVILLQPAARFFAISAGATGFFVAFTGMSENSSIGPTSSGVAARLTSFAGSFSCPHKKLTG